MKRSIWISAALLFCLVALAGTRALAAAQQSSGDLRDNIISMEKQLWEAWKNKDTATFEKHLAPTSVGVGREGVENRQEIIKEIGTQNCNVASYSLDNFQLTQIDNNTVLLTYRGTQDATCDGQKVPATVYASSVYQKSGVRWQAVFHQETPGMEARK